MNSKTHKHFGSKKDRKHLHLSDENAFEVPADAEKSLSVDNSFLSLPDDDIEDKASNILAKDGYLVSKPEHVVKVGSKVNTDYNLSNHDNDYTDDEYDNENENITGKKDYTANNKASIRDLKKQFGFSWKSFSRRLALFGLILAIFGVVSVSTLAALAINRWNEIKPIDDLLNQKRESSVLYARDGKTKIFEVYKNEKREYVTIDKIPEDVQLAVIALEDENFYYSEVGIPWKNLVGAVYKCLQTLGDECRGASGIAQQTVKLATDKNRPSDRTIDTKIDELFSAIKLSSSGKTKAEILELYLNISPFGGVTYGVQSASKTYFDKDVKDLNPIEACFLASLLNQPGTFSSSIGQPESAGWKSFNRRKNVCLENMHTKPLRGDGKELFIKTQEELKALLETPIVVARNTQEVEEARAQNAVVFVPSKVQDEFPHFREYVLQELKKFIPREQDLYTKGYQIITTLDPVKQREIDKILKDSEKVNVIENGGDNAAAVVLDGPTGEIISMVGSLDYNREDIKGKVNVITSSRQPGSSIKPYVYAATLDKGFNPATLVVDATTEFQPGYSPKNFDSTTQGPVSLRNSLQNSLNIPTIKAACLASNNGKLDCGEGIKQVFDFAEKTGLQFACYPPEDNFSKKDASGEFIKQCDDPVTARSAYRSRCGLASAVGGCLIVPLSHATGINTLLQEGNLRTATPIISIKDNTGKELYTPQAKQSVYPAQDKAVDPLIAKQITNVLTDYDARRPKFGLGSRLLEVSECANGAKLGGAAAKTGTTNDVKDTWTIGGCSNYTTAVWIGRTDNQPMKRNATSSTAASPVWNRIMKYLVKDQKPKAFSTDGLVKVNIDPASGLIGGGSSELLTPNQKKILEEAGNKIANPEYVPSQKNIFDFRTTVLSREIQINKIDGKLATNKTLPENIEKKTCLQIVPEFPSVKNWADPVLGIATRSDRYCSAPTEVSDQDQVGEQNKPPLIRSNLDNSKNNVKEITAEASVQGSSNKTITKLEILIEGNVVASTTSNNSLKFTVPANVNSPSNVSIRATDNFGVSSNQVYDNVTFAGLNIVIPPIFDLIPFNVNDIKDLKCESANINSATKCEFNISGGKSLPSDFAIKIGNGGTESSCGLSGNNSVTCNNVNSGEQVGNNVQIFVKIGNNFVNSGRTVKIQDN